MGTSSQRVVPSIRLRPGFAAIRFPVRIGAGEYPVTYQYVVSPEIYSGRYVNPRCPRYKIIWRVTSTDDALEEYRRQALAVAQFCERWGMRYEEILGSDRYIRRLVELVTALEDVDGDFLVIPPGAEIRQEQFIR